MGSASRDSRLGRSIDGDDGGGMKALAATNAARAAFSFSPSPAFPPTTPTAASLARSACSPQGAGSGERAAALCGGRAGSKGEMGGVG